MNRFTVLTFCFLFILFSQGCFEDNLSDYPKTVTYEPEQQKQYPEFDGLTKFIEDGKHNFHSIIIFRDSVIFEKYLPPFTSKDIHDLNSCTKSITATMIGLAIHDGFFVNDSVNLKETFKNYEQDLLLCHLLSMSSGYEFSAFHKEQPGSDILQKLLGQPRPYQPGMAFGYDEGNYHILSNALQLKAGKKLSDYANETIFMPLEINRYYWEDDPDGVTRGDGLLKMTPRDMLKIGKLFLQQGTWNGKEIIPRSWIEKSTTPKMFPVIDEIRQAYGYGWWLPEFGGFAAIGAGGQMIYVNPDSNLVVVTTAGLQKSREMKMLSYLLKKFVLFRDDEDGTVIEDNEKTEISNIYLSKNYKEISGRKFVLEENPLGLNSITLHFEPDTMIYLNLKPGIKMALKAGKFGFLEDEEEKIAVKGTWQNDDNFLIVRQSMDYFERELYDFYFKGNELELKKIRCANEDTVILHGKFKN